MTGENATSESSSGGPAYPNCREPLRGNLRQEQITPQGTTRTRTCARDGAHRTAVPVDGPCILLRREPDFRPPAA